MQGTIFMETFTAPKELVENPCFKEQKQKSLSALADDLIDAPLIEIITRMNERPFCFTLQSCYGHFLYPGQKNPDNLDPLPVIKPVEQVEYRIAYIAFCIENSDPGKRFLEALKDIALIDPKNVQFCSAEWFWKRQVNSYALQVEPDRFKHKDTLLLGYEEALVIERRRNEFFDQLGALLLIP